MDPVGAGFGNKMVTYLKATGCFHRYSWGNMLLIMTQQPTATHVAEYRTWQRVNRQVFSADTENECLS